MKKLVTRKPFDIGIAIDRPETDAHDRGLPVQTQATHTPQ
jgi:hypothetical protein